MTQQAVPQWKKPRDHINQSFGGTPTMLQPSATSYIYLLLVNKGCTWSLTWGLLDCEPSLLTMCVCVCIYCCGCGCLLVTQPAFSLEASSELIDQSSSRAETTSHITHRDSKATTTQARWTGARYTLRGLPICLTMPRTWTQVLSVVSQACWPLDYMVRVCVFT